MTFDVRDFLPSPTDWFTTDVEYEGWGHADFADPQGSLEGRGTLRFEESGAASIEMIVDPSTVRSERTLRFGLLELLSGVQPREVDGSYVLSPTFGSQNPCVYVEIETLEGAFRIENVVGYSFRSASGRDDGGRQVWHISFDIFSGEYEVNEPSKPKYWVLPLSNFVSDLRWSRPELDHHPLRIFPTPEVPEEITHVPHGPDREEREQRAMLALLAANNNNRLVTFEFNEALGFVERLPDYEDRKDRLLRGDDQTRLTAIMVGEVGSNPTADFDELVSWLCPVDMLSLLTLATGTEVGAPWIELRDAERRLVRRSHRRLREPRFSKGHQIVEELPIKNSPGGRTGIGRLITRATSASGTLGEAPLRVAITNLVRSKYAGQTFEESIVYLCRGLDGLCEHYGVARQFLRDSLDAGQLEAVKKALAECAREIRELKRATKATSDHRASAALSTIEGKIANAANTERKFGHAVTDLLGLFGMPDVDIIDEFYRTHPRNDGREHWSDVVSYYRTRVIHYGHLDLSESTEWRDVWTIINHLHDIMARILLRMLEYDGGYQPTVVPMRTVPFALNWVKPDTLADKLGYQSDRTS